MSSVRTKKGKVGKTVAKMAQSYVMGDEPYFDGQLNDLDLIKAFNWYRLEKTVSDSRKYVENYFKSRGKTRELSWINKIPDSVFPLTAGWMARIVDRGGILPSYLEDRIDMRLKDAYAITNSDQHSEKIIEHYVPVEHNNVPVEHNFPSTEQKKTSVYDRVKARVDAFLCEVEGYLDDDRTIDLYDKMVKFQYPANAVKQIIDLLQPRRDEIALVLSGELKEGYNHLSKAELNNILFVYDKWISDAKRYGSNQKKIRNKLRVPKTVPVDKIVKNVKYQAESKEHKIVSVSPTQIVGATEVWLYNTRYGNLTVLRANSDKGLSFKASKVINFDEELSMTKKVARKADYFLKEVMSRTKAKLKSLMNEAKTKPGTLAERINDNTLILRVFRE